MNISILGHNKFFLALNEELPLKEAILDIFIDYRPSKLFTGLDDGPSIWAAQLAFKMSIPYEAAIPYPNFATKYGAQFLPEYQFSKDRAYSVYIMYPHNENPLYKKFTRDQFLIASSDLCVFIYDRRSDDTEIVMDYAKKTNKRSLVINPSECVKKYLNNNIGIP